MHPTNQDPHWVSTLSAHRNTDLLLTGSRRDGWLRVWQVGDGFRNLNELNKIAVSGFINSLSISRCGGWVVAGLGQKHRLGQGGGHRGDRPRHVHVDMVMFYVAAKVTISRSHCVNGNGE